MILVLLLIAVVAAGMFLARPSDSRDQVRVPVRVRDDRPRRVSRRDPL